MVVFYNPQYLRKEHAYDSTLINTPDKNGYFAENLFLQNSLYLWVIYFLQLLSTKSLCKLL